MSRLNAANRAKSELTASINNVATTLSVEDISLFPDPPFLVTIDDEIIEVGGKDAFNDQLTDLVRGREGTIPVDHPSGTSVEHRFTAGTYDGLRFVPKGARFVIGTSTAGWTKYDCDYLCDGVADDVEINAAITALPATGGEIVILDGTYNITAKIDVTKDNVSIKGNGNATILKRMFNSSTAEGVITLTGRSGCKIANLQIEGNKTGYTSSNNPGISLSSSSNNTVTGNTCNNNNNNGISLSSSSNNTITGNTCNNNTTGIYLSLSSNENTITGNTCNNNDIDGIYLSLSSNENTITGNTCNNNNIDGIRLFSSSNENTITGNTCNNNNTNGIYLYSSSNNTVTGNTCNNNNTNGIRLFSSSNNTVTGNTCNNNNTNGIYLSSSSNNTITGTACIRGTGLPTDYTASQYTIWLAGTSNSYNLIAMNNCMGKAVTSGGGTGNTLSNNKWNDDGDVFTATITTTWSGLGPYIQNVTITGISASDIPQIIPVYSATNATAILEKEAWNMISKAITGANKITFTCFEDKPTQAINIKVRRG